MSDKKETGRVIVTYGRSLIALMIAQSLGARGIDVIGCDDVGMTVLSFSKFVSKNCIYTAPDKDEQAFIGHLDSEVLKNMEIEEQQLDVYGEVLREEYLKAETFMKMVGLS